MTVYVIHWKSKRAFGRTLPAGRGEANAVRYILDGHVEGSIVRVECYDSEEGWARDVTEDTAIAVANQIGRDDVREISPELRDFIETHAGLEYARGLRIIDRTFTAA